MFPAEILPSVTVLTGLVTSVSVLIFAGVLDLRGRSAHLRPAVAARDHPGAAALTLGLGLLLAALSVHFRDIRDLLGSLMTLWFFATPIIYPLHAGAGALRPLLDLNPFTHLAVAYQEVLYVGGPCTGRVCAWGRVAAVALVVLIVGYAVFDRLRDTFAEEI